MESTQSTTVFLGAGASAEFGYPVTSQILPKIMSQWADKGELFKDINDAARNSRDRATLRRYVTTLLPGLKKKRPKYVPLVTDVFSLVDHAVVNGTAISGQLSVRAMRRFSELMKQAIFDVLIETWLEEPSAKDLRFEQQMVAWLQSLPGLTIISTNYDTSVDDAICQHHYDESHCRIAASVDFGFDWRDPYEDVFHRRPLKPEFRLYKLHGSLNRLRCALCHATYINLDGTIAHQAFVSRISKNNTCFCGHPRLEMDLVAPSLVRDMRDPNLIQIWASAMESLRTSDRWFIIGYSLPTEDLAIREMLLRAYHARPQPPVVTVVQRGQEAKPKFELLFGRCDYIAGGLRAFL